jgi:hypothetical protein
MYIETLNGFIDWKRHTFHVYHENGESQQIAIDSEGAVVLELIMFKQVHLGALKGFIDTLQEILSKDQIQNMLQLWGNSNAIKISIVTASLGGDRLLAKQVLQIGVDRGVLAVGVNSTWKVVNKEEQKTMKEHAERMKKGITKEPESLVDTLERMKQEGKLEKEEGNLIAGGIAKEVQSKGLVKPTKKIPTEKTIDVIAEPTEQELQQELQALQQKLKEDKWNEDETPWTVNDRMHLIQAQLRHRQTQKDAEPQ